MSDHDRRFDDRRPNETDDERLLREAEDELHAVRRRGARLTPLLDRLHQHLRENAFTERLVSALEHDLRRNT